MKPADRIGDRDVAAEHLSAIRAASLMIRDDALRLYSFADDMRDAIGAALTIRANDEVRIPREDWERIERAAVSFALMTSNPPEFLKEAGRV